MRDGSGNLQTHKNKARKHKEGDQKYFNATDNGWHEDDCTCECVPRKTDWKKFKKFLESKVIKGIYEAAACNIASCLASRCWRKLLDAPDKYYWMLVMDNFLTSVKLVSALFKMGWTNWWGQCRRRAALVFLSKATRSAFNARSGEFEICPGSWTGSGGRGPGDIFAKTNEFSKRYVFMKSYGERPKVFRKEQKKKGLVPLFWRHKVK